VFESNKLMSSNYGTFIGEVYECRGMFRFSSEDFNDDIVNHVSTSVMDKYFIHDFFILILVICRMACCN
jgi:hypothetical protein